MKNIHSAQNKKKLLHNFIFGKNGAENLLKNLNIDLLGKIPIDINMRGLADIGKSYINFFHKTKPQTKF